MDWSLEVVVLPVSDVDRSVAFYRDQVGFHLDHDTRDEHMHVAQLTPPGSGCSIVFGDLPTQNQMQGSMKALQLVVPDAAAARQELLDRGVKVSDLMVVVEADGGDVLRLPGPGWKLVVRAGDQSPSEQPADSDGSHRTGRLGGTMSPDPARCPGDRERDPEC